MLPCVWIFGYRMEVLEVLEVEVLVVVVVVVKGRDSSRTSQKVE